MRATDLSSARSALKLSAEEVGIALGLSPEAVLAAERNDGGDPGTVARLKAYYAERGVSLPDVAEGRGGFSVVDEVERMGDEIEDRPGPHSDPAY